MAATFKGISHEGDLLRKVFSNRFEEGKKAIVDRAIDDAKEKVRHELELLSADIYLDIEEYLETTSLGSITNLRLIIPTTPIEEGNE